MKMYSAFISPIIVLLISNTLVQGQTDLNGTWKGDDNATYYIRHIPKPKNGIKIVDGKFVPAKDEIWWFGQGTNFGNVFSGTINDEKVDQIKGEWADVPIGKSKNSGFITLLIASADRLVLLGEPGNFGVREWKRIKPTSSPLKPPKSSRPGGL